MAVAGKGRSKAALLVVGYGNSLAADDDVGLEVVRRLRAGGTDRAECVELSGGGLDLLDLFDAAEVILLVEAVHSGAPAGTVHLLSLPSDELVARGIGRVSGHGWNLSVTLRLARSLGRPIPRLFLLGVELASVELGAPRTPAVTEAIESIIGYFPRLQSSLLDPQSVLGKTHQTFRLLRDAFN